MYIKSAHTLEARQHHNKTILCLIRVLPRNLEYYYGQTRPCRTYRWMQAEHWAAFDAGLEALLASKEFPAEFQSNGSAKGEPTVEKQFLLNKLIQVRLKQSCVPLQTLCRCISVGSSELNVQNVTLALECIIEYKADGKWKELTLPQKAPIDVKKCRNEYEPHPVSSRADVNPPHDSAAASYVPYTPSAKHPATVPYTPSAAQPSAVSYTPSAKLPSASPGVLRFNYSDEEYTPTTVGDSSSPDKISQTPSPVYNPGRIRNKRAKTICISGDNTEQSNEALNWLTNSKDRCSNRDKETTSSNKKEDSNRRTDQKHNESSTSVKEKSQRQKDKYREKPKDKGIQRENRKLEHECDEPQQERKSRRHKEAAKSDGTRKDADADGDFMSTFGEKYVCNNNDININNKNDHKDATELRRSARSPQTPMRLIETISNFKSPPHKATKKRRKSKSPNTKKPKNSDIFGTDDEDSEAFVKEMPKSKKPSARTYQSAISADTKRRRECSSNDGGNSNREKDNNSTTHWLTKKMDTKSSSSTPPPKGRSQPSSSSHASSTTTKRKARCDSPAQGSRIGHAKAAYSSLEEMEKKMSENKLKIEESRKLNAMLTEIAGPPPPEVQTLTLCELSTDEIMNSYVHHKPKLDEIFEKLHKKNDIVSHDGINHYLVIGLVDHKMQLLMMQKLCEVYENNREGSSVFAKLFTNAMMPEWIISIFMDKYNFTRAEAIKQVKGQEEYMLYTEAQLDHTLII